MIPALAFSSGARAFDFISADGLWRVSLTRDFLALTTDGYERWEDFRAHLDGPLSALHDEYEPAFYSRVGLRYRDVIVRSQLGLQGRPWNELLKPFIAGELAESSAVRDDVLSVQREALLKLEPNIQVRVRHGLAKVDETGEQGYVIDADFFCDERTETTNVITILNQLNSYAGTLFRWCISAVLHDAMEPKPTGQP